MRFIFFLCLVTFFISGCKPVIKDYFTIQGSTMGTTYSVILEDKLGSDLKDDIDSLLIRINKAASTYDTSALISLFNNNYQGYLMLAKSDTLLNRYLNENFILAREIFINSDGAFDPTVMPLVNYWGFGYTPKNKITDVDSFRISDILLEVGMSKLELTQEIINKDSEGIELDFSAIAKGYAVDQVAAMLEGRGIDNYYVEIGGEVFAKGINASGNVWRTGINIPSSEASPGAFMHVLEIDNRGIATSGNYRNFYEVDGKIYSHTINPATGFPERNDLLSATIIAPTCALADGYATACMVLGVEGAKELIEKIDDIEAVLFYTDNEGNMITFDTTKR